MKTKIYKKPVGAHIARTDAPKLYRIEHMRDVDLKENARAIGEALGFTEDQYWTHALPEALLNTLDSQETGAAVAAAIAFLEMKGCQVYPPAEGFRFEITEDGDKLPLEMVKNAESAFGSTDLVRDPSTGLMVSREILEDERKSMEELEDDD